MHISIVLSDLTSNNSMFGFSVATDENGANFYTVIDAVLEL
jgi:hypothetical protein